MELTQARVRELFDYDPDTGILRRRIDRYRARSGQEAGWPDADKKCNGRMRITIDYKKYFVHRVVWLWVHGELPKHEIDHRNGDAGDNRLGNLREATRRENGRNTRRPRTNTSGVKGVFWDKERSKWHAQIHVDGQLIFLGRFDAKLEAHAAYWAAARDLFGEFARVE